MLDTKSWWQSRTIWLNIVAAIFAVTGTLGWLPADLDQEQIVTAIMAIVTLVTIVLRIFARHEIAKPVAGGAN